MSKINFNDFQLKYRFDCQLSQGSFGRVCRIQQRSTKKYYALKKVTVKNLTQLHDIQSQIHILQQHKHPYIVQIIQTYKIQIKNGFAKSTCQLGIVMQLAKYSLEHLIRLKKGITNLEDALKEIIGLVGVLTKLQKENIVHRDIKPANILVFDDGQAENKVRWKLADFGLALDLNKNNGKQDNNNFAGSFQYASPILKKKFRYPHLKIKNNPFKDDVYSLGVTLLELITGLRSYANGGYDKLRQVCQDPRLINLIDIMLQQQQDKRPCFKQLWSIIQKQFLEGAPVSSFQCSSVLQQPSSPSLLPKKPSFTKKQSQASYTQPLGQILQKTVIKNSETDNKINARVQIFEVEKSVQTIASLDGIAMCGCQDGTIIFVKNGNIVHAGQDHLRYVSELFDDGKGYIWSIGGDSIIKKYHKTSLIKSLLSQTVSSEPKTPSLFGSLPTPRLQVALKPTTFEQILLPNAEAHKNGCSTIYAEDNNHFIVGYYDGYVFVKWGDNQYQGKLFYKPVTGIKMGRNRQKVYFCGMSGEVKAFLLNKGYMDNHMFCKEKVPFLAIHTTIQQPNSLTILSQNGSQYILSQSLQPLFQSPNCSPTPTLMASIPSTPSAMNATTLANNNYYVLTLNGEILDCNQQKIAQLGSKGWSCFVMSAQKEIIVGGLHGKLAVVEW